MNHEPEIVAAQGNGSSAATPGPIVPVPRTAISIRPADVKDVPFIDQLQKMHSHMVGWFPTKQIEGKIKLGHVLVAEGSGVRVQGSGNDASSLNPEPRTLNPVGYCIGNDQYFKRDDVGVIYHLNVVPLKQRHLIGATLVKAMFERAAYGCRLFCCWCAQDIQANYFWESVGFIPLAFRTGSRNKQRTHIFWQRRIREGDTTTPYWFPSQTTSGSIREDRIVLPIPPGTHWRDVMPIVLPGMEQRAEEEQKKLPPTRPEGSKKPFVPKVAVIAPPPPKHLKVTPKGKAAVVTASGIRYLDRGDHVPEPEPVVEKKPKRERKPVAKNDPKLIAAARELRDRYLEEFNSGRLLGDDSCKYDVSRALPDQSSAQPVVVTPMKALPQAA